MPSQQGGTVVVCGARRSAPRAAGFRQRRRVAARRQGAEESTLHLHCRVRSGRLVWSEGQAPGTGVFHWCRACRRRDQYRDRNVQAAPLRHVFPAAAGAAWVRELSAFHTTRVSRVRVLERGRSSRQRACLCLSGREISFWSYPLVPDVLPDVCVCAAVRACRRRCCGRSRWLFLYGRGPRAE